ncbi:hypothetical protein K461DRAFT_228195 [Myriangium duriaei CBS 260.36]|uniref:DUF1254 domain-containing protein n=1 Tax=Myriangium duriaei CBS 260.36 TaxID=1168546 RepID=A0A9P4IWR2_9PEZI|nr:hypothetical protein K461DRAFT_228195 [Myriangium duriaei CBS 260.36]
MGQKHRSTARCGFSAAALFGLLATSSAQSTTNATSSATTTTATAQPTIDVNSTVSGALNATAWTLIYAYPLYIFGNFAGNVLKSVPINTIFHQRNLASVNSPGVIKPNIDTLYSRVVLDLSVNDVVLTVPNITDGRYWNYPVYDPYGNNIAEIGNLNNNAPGKYLIRRADDVLAEPGVKLARDYADVASPYQGYVNLPTTHGTLLIRLFVKENTTEDLNTLHTYQNASLLEEVPRPISRAASPAGNLTSLAPDGSLLGISTIEKLLNFTAKIAQYNQPENYTDRVRVAGILGAAGVYDNAYHPQNGVNLTLAAQIANASITADINTPSHVRNLSNGWELSIPQYQGKYATNYAARAYIAIGGYQQQRVLQTLYPGYKNIGFSSAFSLQPNTSLLLSFSGKPKLKASGFWSLSIYGADQYLIPNPLLRGEIGDRSYNLTYQNTGKYVYGPNANASDDGPFQVLIQSVNATPPANWTGNWLPGASSFSFILRWYAPEEAQTNGSYIYPKIDTVPTVL